MSRAKTGFVRSRKHKKILKLAKGFRGANRRLYKRANEAVLHSGDYAYIGRKLRKRDMRRLWIMRISAGLKNIDQTLQYSRLIANLQKNKISLNRKMLAQLAVTDQLAFRQIVDKANK